MKKLVYISLIISIGLNSCYNDPTKENSKIEKKSENTLNQLPKYDSLYFAVDTAFTNGDKIQIIGNYHTENTIVKIHTQNFDTTYNLCEVLRKWCITKYSLHEIRWSTDKFAGIREGCGIPCYYEIVIPLIPDIKPTAYLFPYTNADAGVHLSENLIAFIEESKTIKDLFLIKIVNLVNGKKDSIPLDQKWSSRASINHFIDTINANTEYLFIGQLDESNRITRKEEKRINLK